MLRDLRLKALYMVADAPALLATSGPGGLQVSSLSCSVQGACIYLLLPAGSDHLFNLEHEPELVLTGAHWQLRGIGVPLPQPQHLRYRGPSSLVGRAAMTGEVLVEVVPLRIQLSRRLATPYQETVDFSAGLAAGQV